jgi:hypothetical protein
MSIEKGLYAAPQGIMEDQPDLEIEIEDPESVTLRAGDLEIEIDPDGEEDEFEDNLAEYMPENELSLLAGELIDAYEDDVSSRKDWIQTYVDGLDLLGMKLEERTEPWAGACGVTHPLLSEALVKFQSETIMETFPAAGPVKTKIIGKETPEKKEAAERVQQDMNFRLTEEMPEYRPEHERMLWGLGLSGNAFKKVYYDPSMGRQTSIFVPAEDVVVPYGASSLKTAERVTHVMRKTENELRKLQVAGFYRDIDLGDPVNTIEEIEKKIAEKLGFRATSDDRYRILEMHVDIDLPGYEDVDEDGEETGIALPYIITIEKNTQKVLSIRRNWRPDDKLKLKRNHFVHYGYIPGFGFYYFGLIHLIGAFAKSGTSILRQLVDAGTLSNLPGGLKSRGLRVKGDDTPISPGEFRDVDVPSGSIRDNILPLPYKEPSQVLAALMNQIIEEGRNFANSANLKVSDMSSESPVGTTLAILERTLKVMSAIQARIHYSMHEEFRLLKDIIRDFMPSDYSYQPEDGDPAVKQSDYDQVDVLPVSDPNASTMAQKVVQYQAVLQLAAGAPQLYDLPLLHRQMLDVLGIKNAAKLVPMQDDQRPRDPVTENMDILKGKPVKAFMYQDHEAHIQVHQMAMQDPKVMGLLQQNPNAPQMQAAMMAHINEHLGYEYKKQIEAQIGIQIPDYEDEQTIPEDMETQIAQRAAQASQQLLQQHQQQAQQQQAQQQMQDPIIQMQMQELQIKQAEVQRKIAKDQADAAAKDKQMQVEMARIDAQKEIAGANMAMKHVADSRRDAKDEKMEGFRQGMDLVKLKAGHEQQNKQSHQQHFHNSYQNSMQARQKEKAQPQEKEKPNKEK